MSKYTTAPVSKQANDALSLAAKLDAKQKREYTSFLVLGTLTLSPDEISAIVARGRIVDIALEDGASFNDHGELIVPKNSPYASFFNPAKEA